MRRRDFLSYAVALAVAGGTGTALAATRDGVAEGVLSTWYKLALELVRHTATYSPPVASRTLAYLGVAAFESLASGDPGLHSLVGQLHGLSALPGREPSQTYDTAIILNAVMDVMIHDLFANTGPTGQHALETLTGRLTAQASAGVDADVGAASRGYGETLAKAVLDWSRTDGGAVIDNMGFPRSYTPNPAPGHWVPTSTIVQQQAPLLPDWGKNRPFAMPTAEVCNLPPPLPFSEDPGSAFYVEAMEVYQTTKTLSEEQISIARFWSDDAMLSYTPPGHWTAILNQVAVERAMPLIDHVEALARMGIAMADAFIGCWVSKFEYDLIRPVTYIKKVIDPNWETMLNTPPFPEYPSGHSTQSGAAAAMLTHLFGEAYGFTDESPTPDGSPQRAFASFWEASDEAAISRLYGGIHFRHAIEQGQVQGRCIAQYAIALKTRA
ncbi:MAG: vanadium-dependent haloperoxidase [Cypionkella sp.]